MKKSCLWQQHLQSVLSGVKCWSTSHVKMLLDAWLENRSASPSLVSYLKNRKMGSMQDFCIWIFEVGAVALSCGIFRRLSWDAAIPGKMPQTFSVPFFISGVL